MKNINLQASTIEEIFDFVESLNLTKSLHGIFECLTTEEFSINNKHNIIADLNRSGEPQHASGEYCEFLINVDGEWDDNTMYLTNNFDVSVLRNRLLIYLIERR